MGFALRTWRSTGAHAFLGKGGHARTPGSQCRLEALDSHTPRPPRPPRRCRHRCSASIWTAVGHLRLNLTEQTRVHSPPHEKTCPSPVAVSAVVAQPCGDSGQKATTRPRLLVPSLSHLQPVSTAHPLCFPSASWTHSLRLAAHRHPSPTAAPPALPGTHSLLHSQHPNPC